MALTLPMLLQAFRLHRLDAPVHPVLSSYCGPKQMEATLASSQLLPLGARGIEQQPKPLGVNIA